LVRVNVSRRGGWQVALPDRQERVTCQTLEEARRLAMRSAEAAHPCELVVCDAYHRVLDRQFIDAVAQH
jgi:hypothetical protein